MPEWITIRTPQEGGRKATSRAPFDPATTDALVKAARAVSPGQPTTPAKASFSIYVVLLEFAPGDYRLYVGRTGLTPERALPEAQGRSQVLEVGAQVRDRPAPGPVPPSEPARETGRGRRRGRARRGVACHGDQGETAVAGRRSAAGTVRRTSSSSARSAASKSSVAAVQTRQSAKQGGQDRRVPTRPHLDAPAGGQVAPVHLAAAEQVAGRVRGLGLGTEHSASDALALQDHGRSLSREEPAPEGARLDFFLRAQASAASTSILTRATSNRPGR